MPCRGLHARVCSVCAPLQNWGGFLIATTLTCLLEAVTSQIDNLFLPLYYYVCMIIMFNW